MKNMPLHMSASEAQLAREVNQKKTAEQIKTLYDLALITPDEAKKYIERLLDDDHSINCAPETPVVKATRWLKNQI